MNWGCLYQGTMLAPGLQKQTWSSKQMHAVGLGCNDILSIFYCCWAMSQKILLSGEVWQCWFSPCLFCDGLMFLPPQNPEACICKGTTILHIPLSNSRASISRHLWDSSFAHLIWKKCVSCHSVLYPDLNLTSKYYMWDMSYVSI